MPVQKIYIPRPKYQVIRGPATDNSNYSEALEDALDEMYGESQKPNKRCVARWQGPASDKRDLRLKEKARSKTLRAFLIGWWYAGRPMTSWPGDFP